MDERFALAGKGLYYQFLSTILFIVGMVVLIVPVIGWIAASILVLAGAVLRFMGPYVAREAHPNFQLAFAVSLGILAVTIIKRFGPDEGWLAGLISIASAVLGFLVAYFICTAAGELLAEKGDMELAQRAALIWKLTGLCSAVFILHILIGWIPVLGAIVGVAGIAATIVSIVVVVLRIIFEYKASQSLRGK